MGSLLGLTNVFISNFVNTWMAQQAIIPSSFVIPHNAKIQYGTIVVWSRYQAYFRGVRFARNDWLLFTFLVGDALVLLLLLVGNPHTSETPTTYYNNRIMDTHLHYQSQSSRVAETTLESRFVFNKSANKVPEVIRKLSIL